MLKYNVDLVVLATDYCVEAAEKALAKGGKFDLAKTLADWVKKQEGMAADFGQSFLDEVGRKVSTELALRAASQAAARPEPAGASPESVLVRRQMVGFATRSMFGYAKDESDPVPISPRRKPSSRLGKAKHRKAKSRKKR